MLSPTLGTSPAPTRWLPWVLAVALFWLSGSLLLDLLVMPVMYTSGMMAGSNFATAGYSLFEAFNHVELLCAALILTGLLTLRRSTAQAFGAVVSGSRCRWAVGIATLLLTLALVYTYGLTPEMGALGLSLDAFATQVETPAAMAWMHGAYWGLELVKLAGLGFLLSLCAQDLSTSTQ